MRKCTVLQELSCLSPRACGIFPNFIINFFEKQGSLTLSAAVSVTLELL